MRWAWGKVGGGTVGQEGSTVLDGACLIRGMEDLGASSEGSGQKG